MLLGDPDYEYPLLLGFLVKGEGIRFVRRTSSDNGALLKRLREANTPEVANDTPSTHGQWHAVSDAPGIELLRNRFS